MKGYHIFIWSHDHPHPPHVHFRKGKSYSTWHLQTFRCIDTGGFPLSDLRTQAKLLQKFHEEVLRSWNAHWQAQ